MVDVFLSCISLFVFLFCWKVARILFGIVGKNPTRTKLSFCKKVTNQLIKQNPTPHFLSGDHSQPRVPHIKLKYAYIRLLQSFFRLCVYVVFRVVLLFFFQCSKRDKHTTRFKCEKIRIKILKKEWFRIDLLVSVCSCKRNNNSEWRKKKNKKNPKSHLCSFQTLTKQI